MPSASVSVLITGSESMTASTSGCFCRAWELQKPQKSGLRLPNVVFVSKLTLEKWLRHLTHKIDVQGLDAEESAEIFQVS